MNRWHYYELVKLAPAFFINNLLNVCSNKRLDDNSSMWFRIDPNDPLIHKEDKIQGQKNLFYQ